MKSENRNILKSNTKSHDRPKKIGVRFKNIETLASALNNGLKDGYFTVYNAEALPLGRKVELLISLPGCLRLLEVPAIVESSKSPVLGRAPGSMKLRLAGDGTRLPKVLDRFMKTCKGKKCSSAPPGEPMPCDLLEDFNARAKQGQEQPVQRDESPKNTNIINRTVNRKVNHNGTNANIFAQSTNNGNKNPGTGRKRRTSIMNILSSLGAHTNRDKKKTTLTGAQVMKRKRKLTGSKREKATALVEEAGKLLNAGNKAKALSLLRVAVAFDPTNMRAKALLKYAEK
ncbi:MAG: hypothetical protein GXP49_00595 [Deltaproteobacteria bacterium]|nr:hypothetical protein [Deltaproteobacteria bacterium]